ncbi:GNAT family N-acetyltransferase [Kitasatospora sp. NPDC059817]|uniref:GNAT family N-acetyltransferase n=1 Tax=Kitasatospora sp. NPDC059817 TaxID=3346961 RepID=UPI00365EC98A
MTGPRPPGRGRRVGQPLGYPTRQCAPPQGARTGVRMTAKDGPRTEYGLAVTHLGEHRLIGYARLATEPQQAATVGFALHPAEWGKGLGTATVHLLCALGFDVLGMHRIWAARSPLNEASARTLLRAGMTEDGRIRDHVFVHGAWRDSITYSILEHEWTPMEGWDQQRQWVMPAGPGTERRTGPGRVARARA